MNIFSSERRRRRRISITAGEESEANVTCGFTARKQNVLEEGEHKQAVKMPHMFALFEDDLPSFMRPQASLPSAAQPAVMDIRRLRRRSGKRQNRTRRRSLEINAHNIHKKLSTISFHHFFPLSLSTISSFISIHSLSQPPNVFRSFAYCSLRKVLGSALL